MRWGCNETIPLYTQSSGCMRHVQLGLSVGWCGPPADFSFTMDSATELFPYNCWICGDVFHSGSVFGLRGFLQNGSASLASSSIEVSASMAPTSKVSTSMLRKQIAAGQCAAWRIQHGYRHMNPPKQTRKLRTSYRASNDKLTIVGI